MSERITELTAVSGSLSGTMLFPVVDLTQPSGDRTRKATLAQAAEYVTDAIGDLGLLQPGSSELTALANQTGTGFMARSGSEDYDHRTMTGTANEITVSNGDGSAGDPTWSLPASMTMTGKVLTGGSYGAITSFGLRSTGAAFDLKLASSEVLTSARTLSVVLGDTNRTLTVGASAAVSGANTGDQTITLTGDVTGTGTGSFAATIGAAKIMASMLNVDAVTGLTTNNSPTAANDYLVYYNAAAGALRKVTIATVSSAGVSGVSSFNGRTGAVSPTASDYNFTDLAGTIAVGQFPNDVVTYAKIQNVSAQYKVLGRSSSGAGDIEELSTSSAGVSFLAAADAAAQTALLSASSTTVSGRVELATNTETTTGTDATRALSPDGFAHSDYGKRVVSILVTDPNGSAITTGDGKAYFRVNSVLNGYNLVGVAAHVTTVSSVGIPTIQIANVTDTVDMLSTKLTIDATEKDSSTAATPAVIDATKDDVATGDELRIDIDVAGTGAKGLSVDLTFQLP
jgi:hypothetical protein